MAAERSQDNPDPREHRGTVSDRESDSPVENPPETPEGVHSLPCPQGPRLALMALCLSLALNFPQGWLQASLPNFLSRGCQVLAHCCIVREVRKTAWSLQGLFPSSASWPNLQEKQQRAAGKAHSLV